MALSLGHKVGVYCSDVAGAFDKVPSGRLAEKLQAKGVTTKVFNVLVSWLEYRYAVVVVDGVYSKQTTLTNMVYQGTVWGPPLWNTYFEDARLAVNQCGFDDVFFADDLTCD